MKQFDFEAIFNYYSDDPYIFTPSILEDFKNEDIELPDNYNIYFITWTNRAWFLVDSLTFDNKRNIVQICIVIMNQYDRNIMCVQFEVPNEVKSIEVSDFPHKYLIFKNSKNEEIQTFHIHDFLLKHTPILFEVLYIGRSYGVKKKLNIVDRLYNQNHKALKSILMNITELNPDKEALIMAFNFRHKQKIFSTGFEYFESTYEREKKRINAFNEMHIPRKIEVDIIEEILINYFRPKYNNYLKHSIDALNTKAARFFVGIDISGLVVEFATKETGVHLYTDIVPPKRIHLINIPMFKDESRLVPFNESDIESSRKKNIDFYLDM